MTRVEARKFFEGSNLEEITVSATPEEWRDVLLDLGVVNEGLETGSTLLEEKLRELGIW